MGGLYSRFGDSQNELRQSRQVVDITCLRSGLTKKRNATKLRCVEPRRPVTSSAPSSDCEIQLMAPNPHPQVADYRPSERRSTSAFFGIYPP
jgi:hypothetical protein